MKYARNKRRGYLQFKSPDTVGKTVSIGKMRKRKGENEKEEKRREKRRKKKEMEEGERSKEKEEKGINKKSAVKKE